MLPFEQSHYKSGITNLDQGKIGALKSLCTAAHERWSEHPQPAACSIWHKHTNNHMMSNTFLVPKITKRSISVHRAMHLK